MSFSYVTFDTVTVGLGEDADGADTLAMSPPTVLARTPRVRGDRRHTSTGAPAAPASEFASFEVTTTPNLATTTPKHPAPRTRISRHDPPAEPPAPQPTADVEESLSTTLLRMQSSGPASSKLILALLLAAAAGATLLLLGSSPKSVGPTPSEPPPWTSAPLAEAPLFNPEPIATEALPVFESPELVAPPAATAAGPVSMAKKKPSPVAGTVQEADSFVQTEPPAPTRVATLPSPYPTTEYKSTEAAVTGVNPSARLTGIRPAPAASSSSSPASSYEQDRPGLY